MARRNKPAIDDELIATLPEGGDHSAALLGNDGLIGKMPNACCSPGWTCISMTRSSRLPAITATAIPSTK